MDELLGDSTLDDAQIAMLQATLTNAGAVDKLEQVIDQHVAEAHVAIATAGLNDVATAGLMELAALVSRRAA
jgi:geranylgeranyl diphosphate synthase type I